MVTFSSKTPVLHRQCDLSGSTIVSPLSSEFDLDLNVVGASSLVLFVQILQRLIVERDLQFDSDVENLSTST